jgi:hypothetical protein
MIHQENPTNLYQNSKENGSKSLNGGKGYLIYETMEIHWGRGKDTA